MFRLVGVGILLEASHRAVLGVVTTAPLADWLKAYSRPDHWLGL